MTVIPFDRFGDQGPTLHFAHANGYPPGCYRRFLSLLGQQAQVWAMHHRPLWSDMDPWEMRTWHLLTRDLIAFMETHGLYDVLGVGHSMGGVATLYAALERPELFRAVVLIDPVFLPAAWLEQVRTDPTLNPYEMPLVAGALKRRASWESLAEAFARFRPKEVFSRLSDAALWDYVHAVARPAADGGYQLAYPRAWEARIYALPPTDVWECLPRLTHPTLALRGTDSDTLHPSAWAMWQQLQPQATFVEIPAAGHLLTMEQPFEVAGPVLRFLRAHWPA